MRESFSFLSYYIIARDHLCDPWMESKMPNFPPTEAAAADTSFRPFKKKKRLYVYLWSRGTRATVRREKGPKGWRSICLVIFPFWWLGGQLERGDHTTRHVWIITCVWHACYSTRMTAFSRFFLLAQPRTPSLLYMSCVFCKLFRAKVALLL